MSVTAYRGYLICRCFADLRWFIKKDGAHICYCLDLHDGKRIVNELTV